MNTVKTRTGLWLTAALVLFVMTVAMSPVMAKKPIPGAMGSWEFDWRGKGNSNGSGTVTFLVDTMTADGYTGTFSGSGTDNDGGAYTVTGTWTQVNKDLSGTLDLSGSIVDTGVVWTAKISGNAKNMTMSLGSGSDKLKVKLDHHTT